jgi:hypothetical protein
MKPKLLARFTGADTALYTDVGRREGYAVVSTGKAGVLLYGPYMDLEPGYYLVEVYGHAEDLNEDDAIADVCIETGQKILNKQRLQSTVEGRNGLLAAMTFTIDTGCKDLEVRISIGEMVEVKVELIEIKQHLSQNIIADDIVEQETIVNYCGSDPAIFTEVGIRNGGHMESSGQYGYLIYGPYLSLPKGRYLVTLYGKSELSQENSQLADVEVCANAGALVFAEGEIYGSKNKSEEILLSLNFLLDKPHQRIEIRVRTASDSFFLISKIEISTVADSVALTLASLTNVNTNADIAITHFRKLYAREKKIELIDKMALAFIVKDEMPVVLEMLESVYNAIGFVSFVDTGSSDDSVKNIKRFLFDKSIKYSSERIILDDFDFSTIRNKSIEMIPRSFEWVLVLDCDEVILAEDIACINILLKNGDHDAWELPRYNYKRAGFHSKTVEYPDYQGRLFKNNGIIQYSGKVHEKISGYTSIGRASNIKSCTLHIHHIKRLFAYKYSVMAERSEFYNTLSNG